MTLVTRSITIISFVCLILTRWSLIWAQDQQTTQNARLPNTLVPKWYNLELIVDVVENSKNFSATVIIEIECVTSTNQIVLHAKELTIEEKKVTIVVSSSSDANAPVVQILSHNYDTKNDLYVVTVNENFAPQTTYQITIPYWGKLRDDSTGFYKSSYVDGVSGQTKWMALTFFDPNNARLAVPCFDEPGFKASFVITVGHASYLTAVSNMPLAASKKMTDRKDWILDTFAESPPLSTYVVCIIVSELEIKEAQSDQQSSLLIRTLVRSEFVSQIEFAQSVTTNAALFFKNYFAYDFPSTKLDVGIIPAYPIAGMENFGLINVSESPILISLETATIFNKFDSASIVCTEVANQWLGDIVTIKWWNDLWLMEAFGDFFSIIAINNIFPEWKAADLAFMRTFLNALEADGLKTSHAVAVPITDPKETETLYDTITYEKGSFLIRTLNLIVGDAAFQESLRTFVQYYGRKNANRDDLWSIITETAQAYGTLPNSVNIKDVMDSWLVQAGYPLLNVTRNYEAGTVTIKQERFLYALNTQNTDDELKNACWMMPLTYTTSKELKFDTIPRKWLTCEGPLTFKLELEETEWIIFNLRLEALCHVNYDPTNWKAIKNTLLDAEKYWEIEVLSRVQIITDSFALAWTGAFTYADALDLTQYLKADTEYLPWRKGLRSFAELRVLLLRTNILESFQQYVRNLLEPKYLEFGDITVLSADDYLQTHFKTFVIFWACIYAIKDCQKQSQAIFDEWMNTSNPDQNNPIPSDIRSTVYCQAAQLSDSKYWDFLFERYRNSNVPTELSLISAALACSLNTATLETYLSWSLDENQIRREESSWVFSSVSDNDKGFEVVKTFLYTRFNDIYSYHDGDSIALAVYFSSVATLIMTADELTEFENFVNSVTNQLQNIQGTIQSGIESAQNNISWHSLHFEEVSKFLTQ